MQIARVARAANVSYATAWRVIHNRPCASPRAVEAVRRAMAAVGYVPPPDPATGLVGVAAAAAAVDGDGPRRRRGRPRKDWEGIRTRNVALLLLRQSTGISTAVLSAVQRMLAARDLNMVFAAVREAGDLPPAVRRGEVDGILGYGQMPDGGGAGALRHRVPAVWMMSRADVGTDPWGDRVRPDNEAIGRAAAQVLLGRGHRVLGWVEPPGGPLTIYRQRLAGFRETARVSGAEVVEFRGEGDGSAGGVEAVAAAWRGRRPRATALFVPVDRVTLKVYRALGVSGATVGRDVDLVSCDNQREILDLMHPQPVSIDLQREEIARLAVDRLLWRMKHGTDAPQVVMTVLPKVASPAVATPPANGLAGTAAAAAPAAAAAAAATDGLAGAIGLSQ